MAALRYRSGGSSVTVGPERQQVLDRIEDGAFGVVRKGLTEEMDTIAEKAGREWYTQVKRRTGKSGQWSAGVAVSDDTLSGYVESGDTRRDKRGRPAWVFVRRPGVLSTIEVKVESAEYAAVVRHYRDTGTLPAGYDAAFTADGRPTNVRRKASNPLASDGKTVAQDLVIKPVKRVAKGLTRRLGPEIARLARKL